jgi:hypothetical protein
VPKPLVLASVLVLGLDYPERGDDSSPERRTAEAETGRWGGGGGERDLGRLRWKNEEIGGGARLGRVLDHGAAVLSHTSAARGNTQTTPAGGDLFHDRTASLTERNPPAVTNVRAPTKVGPTSSLRRVTHGRCLSLSSRRTNQHPCSQLRTNGQDVLDGKIRRSRSEDRCESPYGGHRLYL